MAPQQVQGLIPNNVHCPNSKTLVFVFILLSVICWFLVFNYGSTRETSATRFIESASEHLRDTSAPNHEPRTTAQPRVNTSASATRPSSSSGAASITQHPPTSKPPLNATSPRTSDPPSTTKSPTRAVFAKTRASAYFRFLEACLSHNLTFVILDKSVNLAADSVHALDDLATLALRAADVDKLLALTGGWSKDELIVGEVFRGGGHGGQGDGAGVKGGVLIIWSDASQTNHSAEPSSTAPPEGAPPEAHRVGFHLRFLDRFRPVVVVVLAERGTQSDFYDGFLLAPITDNFGPARAFSKFHEKPLRVVDGDAAAPAPEVFRVPSSTARFLWELEASEFIECNEERTKEFEEIAREADPNLETKLTSKKKIRDAMELVVGLRKQMAIWRKRNFLIGGTLLGWYRQCSVIPHDHDLDTCSWIDDYEPWVTDFFVANQRRPQIDRIFGRADDSLEYRLRGRGMLSLDLFWLYRHPNFTWLGIQTFDKKHTKKISIYPPFERICSGELHGYLVNVPCETESILRMEYGETWMQLKRKYNYQYHAKNWRNNGTWTDKEWNGGEVYKAFKLPYIP